jgi:hypothetical protein
MKKARSAITAMDTNDNTIKSQSTHSAPKFAISNSLSVKFISHSIHGKKSPPLDTGYNDGERLSPIPFHWGVIGSAL